jgi:glycosyltransferase involved in cell wall biosynthesis
MKETISVCIPVYNGAETIFWTIESILNQTQTDFELLIADNCSTDNTREIIASFDDPRIRLVVNETNRGCGGNLESCKENAKGDILFYISADDIADKNALKTLSAAFQTSDEIGIVTRPYYWFDETVTKAVRAKKQFKQNKTVSMSNSFSSIRDVIGLADQISGIGFRKKFMTTSFIDKPFIEMASMVLPMLKSCKAIILKENIVAIRISNSGAQSPKVFVNSPMKAWMEIINSSYPENDNNELRKYLTQNFVANNYVGLVQIKNFGGLKPLFRELSYMISLDPRNIFKFQFWVYSLASILIPGCILKRMVVVFKNHINSRLVQDVKVCELITNK